MSRARRPAGASSPHGRRLRAASSRAPPTSSKISAGRSSIRRKICPLAQVIITTPINLLRCPCDKPAAACALSFKHTRLSRCCRCGAGSADRERTLCADDAAGDGDAAARPLARRRLETPDGQMGRAGAAASEAGR
jgi:hypothetical protein